MKIDFHVHSKFSRDSLSEPARLVKMAVRRGLDGFAITDHETFGAATTARKAASRLAPDLLVIAGQEICSEYGDILCLFLEREVESRSFDDLVEEVHGQGGIVALPHMFDSMRKSSLQVGRLSARQVHVLDAVEAFNARTWDDRNNLRAAEFAASHGKPVIAGSDAHFGFELGTAFTIVGGPTEKDVKRNILAGKTFIQGKPSRFRPFFAHMLTFAAKRAKKFL